MLLLAQETHVDKCLDEFGETLVAESSSDNSVCLRNGVALLVGSRVTVGVGNEGVSRVDEVRLGLAHELRAWDIGDLAVPIVLGRVTESEQDTTAAPRELVSKWVVAGFGCWETTAVAEEAGDLAAGLVDLVNGLDGVQVVNTGVETNLVHDSDACLLGCGIELQHGGRDV